MRKLAFEMAQVIALFLMCLALRTAAQATNYLNPGRQDVITGNTATLYCPFNFGGAWTWTWTRDNTSVATNTLITLRDPFARTRYTSSRVSDSCQLQITKLQISDNGTYVCRILENNYFCVVELLARERAFIITPSPPVDQLYSEVIEVDATATSSQFPLSCTVLSPSNPQADLLYIESVWRIKSNSATSRFEIDKTVLSAQSNSMQSPFLISRRFTKRDAANVYTCASYQPLPRYRPSNFSDYLSMPGDLVDSRQFRLLINDKPYVRSTSDYNTVLQIIRRQLFLFFEIQPSASSALNLTSSIAGVEVVRELVSASQFDQRQSIYCVVDTSAISSVSFEFRSASSSQFIGLSSSVVGTHLSSVNAVACDASSKSWNSSSPLCAAFSNLDDGAKAMFDELLRYYLRVYEFQIDKFGSSNLGTYRCSALNQYGSAFAELTLAQDSSTSTSNTARPGQSSKPNTGAELSAAGLNSAPVFLTLILVLLSCRFP